MLDSLSQVWKHNIRLHSHTGDHQALPHSCASENALSWTNIQAIVSMSIRIGQLPQASGCSHILHTVPTRH